MKATALAPASQHKGFQSYTCMCQPVSCAHELCINLPLGCWKWWSSATKLTMDAMECVTVTSQVSCGSDMDHAAVRHSRKRNAPPDCCLPATLAFGGRGGGGAEGGELPEEMLLREFVGGCAARKGAAAESAVDNTHAACGEDFVSAGSGWVWARASTAAIARTMRWARSRRHQVE